VGPLNFSLFLLQTVALNILMTWIYVHTKGSLLISGLLFHAALDVTGTIFLSGLDLSGVGLSGMNGSKVMMLITAVLWVAAMSILAIFGPHLRRRQQGERTL
jgi:hypothetical protein